MGRFIDYGGRGRNSARLGSEDDRGGVNECGLDVSAEL